MTANEFESYWVPKTSDLELNYTSDLEKFSEEKADSIVLWNFWGVYDRYKQHDTTVELSNFSARKYFFPHMATAIGYALLPMIYNNLLE